MISVACLKGDFFLIVAVYIMSNSRSTEEIKTLHLHFWDIWARVLGTCFGRSGHSQPRHFCGASGADIKLLATPWPSAPSSPPPSINSLRVSCAHAFETPPNPTSTFKYPLEVPATVPITFTPAPSFLVLVKIQGNGKHGARTCRPLPIGQGMVDL